MITFIAFVLTILGCVNWLLIGLLQYDFIAGFFGFQASIFSRIIYIIFGIAASYLVIRTIVNKGNFKVYEKRKKKSKNEAESQQQAPAYANVEAARENVNQQKAHEATNETAKYPENNFNHDSSASFPQEEKPSDSQSDYGLFDEHFQQDK